MTDAPVLRENEHEAAIKRAMRPAPLLTADSLTSALFRRGAFWFALLIPCVLVGFWPTYFYKLLQQPNIRLHLHGVAMMSWVLLLVAQAWLIRTNHRPWHRAFGRASLVLFPVVVYSTLSVAHWRLRQGGAAIPTDILYFFYLQLALLVLFVLAYSLAIAHRKTPRNHARYMLCTALPLLDPIFARIFYFGFGIDFPFGQILTYALMDGILLWLAIIDRRSESRVFVGLLLAFVALQAPTFFLYRSPAWQAFAQWYAALPLV